MKSKEETVKGKSYSSDEVNDLLEWKEEILSKEFDKKVAELRKEIKKIQTKYDKFDPYTKRMLSVLNMCLKTINRKVDELFGCEKLTKDKTDVEICRSYVSKSVVGSQNQEGKQSGGL